MTDLETNLELPKLDLGSENGQVKQSIKFNQPDSDPIIVYPVGDYSIIELKNTEDLPRRLFRRFIDRSMDFIEEYGAHIDPVWLGQLLYNAFAVKSPHVLMLIAYDKEETIVAHITVYPEIYPKLGWVGHILQLEKDVNEPEIMQVGLKLIQEWAKNIGIKTLVNSTESKAHTKLFQSFGFSNFRYIMRKDLKEDSEEVV